MIIQTVLIFTKKSAYQAYFQEYHGSSMKKLLESGDKGLLHIRRTHGTHYETLRHVKKVLSSHGVAFHVCFRGQNIDISSYDLVIAVGGDGTFLEASHRLRNQLILGVNSDTNHSVGNFAVLNRSNFEKFFNQIMQKKYSVQKLSRLKIQIDQENAGFLALNEVLVCHASPAAMSHYVLKIGSVSERQRSSGVWIATPSGSTAAIHSAGGKQISHSSQAIQYLPRELFDGHGVRYKLHGGVLKRGRTISVVSQMQKGMVYIDGPHQVFRFKYGQTLKVSLGAPLRTVRFGALNPN